MRLPNWLPAKPHGSLISVPTFAEQPQADGKATSHA